MLDGKERGDSVMTNQIDSTKTAASTAARLGVWAAILTSIFTFVAFAIGMATPPISGAFCQNACVTYPYASVASSVPRDYLWMYFSLMVAPLFVALVACIHHCVASEMRVFSQIGLSFAVISAAMLALDYFIQLSVVQPSLVNGESEGLALFLQYNPHGIFIALEDFGYIMMSLALGLVGAAMTGRDRLEHVIRWLFIASALVVIAARVVLALQYGHDLEYRFEIFAISINWTLLIVSGVLLSIWFRRVWRRAHA
jgi:hypothetical protein